jgi:8-oxo-dGTP pyrophosphatase MutT (NUDIX family)
MKEPEFLRNEYRSDHLKYAVIAARFDGKWIFCRHKDRSTWEIPGGHIEPGETPLDAAKRELYEETGAVDADIHIVGGYRLYDDGLLCFAEVNALEPVPADSEIAEIRLYETLPDDLTYGIIHQKLFHWVQGWLNFQSGAGEIWDIYDESRVKTGRTHRRGDYLAKGDYHLVVHIWLLNSDGRFLITKRSPNKGFPNMWECSGGSALAGDDSLAAAVREVKEETGLTLDPKRGEVVLTYRGTDYITDVWLFRQDFDLSDVQLLEGETCDVMYASVEELLQLRADGVLVPFSYLDELLADL